MARARRRPPSWSADAEHALRVALDALRSLDEWIGDEDGPDPMPPHELLRRHSQAIMACEFALYSGVGVPR